LTLISDHNYTMSLAERVKSTIRDIQDYPKPGILFKDITPVFHDPQLMREIVQTLARRFRTEKIDAVAAIEARGFIFGAVLAHELNCKFVPIRKAGKLPFKSRRQEYALEYGTAAIEMHIDAVAPDWRVLVHDDLLATGGTATAAGELVQGLGAELAGFSFIINLGFLPGEQNIVNRFGVKPYYIVEY
jgi:adenine phosphoribosyltransferase